MESNGKTNPVRQRIIDSARELFISNGYDGTSIRDIANASDTNVAMVNYYFRSKLGLFEIIFGEAFDILVTRIFKVLASEKPTMDIIETWIDTYYSLLAQYPQIPNFILTAATHNPETIAAHAWEHDPEKVFGRFSELLGKEVAAGEIRDYPAIDVALNIVSLCGGR